MGIELHPHDWKTSMEQRTRRVGPAQAITPAPPAVGASEAFDRHLQV